MSACCFEHFSRNIPKYGGLQTSVTALGRTDTVRLKLSHHTGVTTDNKYGLHGTSNTSEKWCVTCDDLYKMRFATYLARRKICMVALVKRRQDYAKVLLTWALKEIVFCMLRLG
jgi:hypothetical protein